MASVLLFLAVVAASLVCVRAGAVALELTGMEPEKARFQALSAFTNTGFTTREAEEITGFPIRRKIIAILIVLGRVGAVSVIATFATSLLQRTPIRAALNAGIIVVSVYVVYRLALWGGLTRRMREFLRGWLVKRYGLSVPSLEEMLQVGEGIGVVRVAIQEGSQMVGRRLADLRLQARRVQILSIVRGEQVIAVPQGDDSLASGDVVICYGDMEAARALFPAQSEEEGPRAPG